MIDRIIQDIIDATPWLLDKGESLLIIAVVVVAFYFLGRSVE